MRTSFFIVIGVIVGVSLLINQSMDEPVFASLSDKANFELRADMPERAEKTLFKIVLRDSLQIENHYRYISTHFDIPESNRVGKRTVHRDDDGIQLYYERLALLGDSRLNDIGYYGQGLIQVNHEKYTEGLNYFKQIKDQNLHYVNNSIGYAYKNIDLPGEAERFFRKEIANNGNVDGAYSNLIQLLFDQNRMDEVNAYLKDPEVKKYFPSQVERAIYFKSGQVIRYGENLFSRIFSGFNRWGAMAALLIMGAWVMYLRKLDIFEPEQWKHIFITVSLGMVFSFLTYPLSDFNNLIFGFKLNGEVVNDFFYSVLGIGAIEELVKIIPLLVMMRFTKAVNEPFDYIKYASLSALGFAFVENLIYFDVSGLHIIHGRALTATVSHMFDSSIIAYGILLNKYKMHKNPYLNFILFFALAAISHGFYDFWLINDSAKSFSIITVLFLLMSMFMWNSFKNNALNHSDFFDHKKSIEREKLQDYLVYSLSGILLFEYVALAFTFSPNIANSGLASALLSGSYLIIFLSINLSKFSLIKGLWAPIQYWSAKEEKKLDE